MEDTTRNFDLVIFGATGFTGFFVIRELIISISSKSELSSLKWAIAGRNKDKLNQKLAKIAEEMDVDLSKIEIIIADVNEEKSLLEMAKRTKLIINCVGPFHLFGRQVVRACVEAGTHHIDISGEPNYMDSMVVEYYEQAVQKGLIIISACGWDSIPCDIGVDFAKRNFDGRLHSVETFLETIPGSKGYVINFGTLQSAMYGYQNMNKLGAIRRQMYTKVFPEKIPKSRIILSRRKMPFIRDGIQGYNVEFPGSDRSVVQRTQHYNYIKHNEPPLQIQTYYTIPDFSKLIKMMLFGIMFALMTATSFGQNLLSKYPKFFTRGAFSKEGPTREQIESTRFQTIIQGKGWSKREIGNIDPHSEPETTPDSKIIVKVTGPDPGYMATSLCVLQAGLTILLESEKMPRGVLTPASAFRNTQLFQRLQDRGLKMEILEK